ncbi:MAG: ABC transporter substrate-binding protein [Burkholderiales bacterium]|nr:ABC transporter substrate-binding protein [Burkholderiales bacterium]
MLKWFDACRIGLMTVVAIFAAGASAQTIRLGTANVTQQTHTITYSSVPSTYFWKEEGLNVQLIGLAGANATIEALDAGQVDVAVPATSAVFALLQARPQSDLVAFYTFTNSFNALPAVPKDSPIRRVRDLMGKTIGVQNLANSQVALTRAMVKLDGGDPAALKFIAVGEGVEAVRALQTKQVDAVALFDSLYALIEAEGVPLRILESDQVQSDKVGFVGVLVTKRAYFEQNREALTRLARGVAKASVFAKHNPQGAVRVHWAMFPVTRQRGVSEEAAMRRSLLPMQARLQNVHEVGGLWGNATPEQIAGYQQLLLEGGVLKQRVDTSRLWNPSLLKEINNFDRKSVEKLAEQAK